MKNQYLMYLRKSRTDKDFSDEPIMATLQRHKSRLDEYCQKNGITVDPDNILYEVCSGDSIASRPMMMELLRRVETGRYTAVLCVDMDRLSRGSGADQALVINTFKYSDTKIITPYKTYDFSDDTDEQFAELGLFLGRNEYRMIKRRMMQGKRDAAKEGKYPASNAPYGYETYKLPKQKGFSLRIIPEQADIVRLIYDLYANQNKGAYAIAKHLNSANITNQFGRPWIPAHISKILRDPTYTGKLRYAFRINKKVIKDGNIVTMTKWHNPDMILTEGLHDAIIPQDLYNKAQAVKLTHSIPPIKGKNLMRNPLCSIVKCSACGKSLLLRSPDKYGSLLYCPTPNCSNYGTYLEDVEKELLSALGEWLRNYEIAPKVKSYDEEIKAIRSALEALKKDIEAERQKQERIYTLLEDGVYDTATFNDRISVSSERLLSLTAKFSETEDTLRKLEQYQASQDSFIPMAQDIVSHYYSIESPAERNKLLRLIVDHADYTRTVKGRSHRGEFDLVVYPKLPQ